MVIHDCQVLIEVLQCIQGPVQPGKCTGFLEKDIGILRVRFEDFIEG
jgi:hypothetical protein